MPEFGEAISWAVAAFLAIAALRLVDGVVAGFRNLVGRYREWRWERAWRLNKDGWPT